MHKTPRSRRAAFSLLEVLIAMFILLLGITAILVLFPVGVSRVARAVLDTRCTLLAQAMWQAASVHGMLDDPLHKWSKPGVADAGDPAAPPNFLQTPFQSTAVTVNNGRSYYINIVPDNGVDPMPAGPAVPPPPPVTRLDNVSMPGIPLLIDPLWVHARYSTDTVTHDPGWQNSRQTSINLSAINTDFPNMGPTFGGVAAPVFHSARVVTTWEAASIFNAAVRGAYINRWFTSPGDIEYREQYVGTPHAPADPIGPATIADPGNAFPLATSASSGSRNRPYSWALMIERSVIADAAGFPRVDAIAKSALLVFYKRNLVTGDPKPYTVAAGAFVDNDNRVTLYYPAGERPRIRKGTWLCELTIVGSGDPVTAPTANRRTFEFHRVKDFEEAVDAGGRPFFSITLTRNASGYNAGPRAVGAFPDLAPGTSPFQYFPIVIFDGLQEVFDTEGVLAQ